MSSIRNKKSSQSQNSGKNSKKEVRTKFQPQGLLSDLGKYVKEKAKKYIDPKLRMETRFGDVELGLEGLRVSRPRSNNSVITSAPLTQTRVMKTEFRSANLKTKHGPIRRVWGRQQVCNISENNTTSLNLTAVTGGATLTSNGDNMVIYLNPDILGGPLALESRVYARCRFNTVVLHANMGQGGTSTARNMNAIAYFSDGAVTAYQTVTYISLTQVDNNMMFNAWQNSDLVLQLKPMLESFIYCESDLSTSSTTRQTSQGAIISRASDNASATTVLGQLWISYEVDLDQRISDLGFTFSVKEANLFYSAISKLATEARDLLWGMISPRDQKRLLMASQGLPERKIEETEVKFVPVLESSKTVELKELEKPKSAPRVVETVDYGDTVILSDGYSRNVVKVEKEVPPTPPTTARMASPARK